MHRTLPWQHEREQRRRQQRGDDEIAAQVLPFAGLARGVARAVGHGIGAQRRAIAGAADRRDHRGGVRRAVEGDAGGLGGEVDVRAHARQAVDDALDALRARRASHAGDGEFEARGRRRRRMPGDRRCAVHACHIYPGGVYIKRPA